MKLNKDSLDSTCRIVLRRFRKVADLTLNTEVNEHLDAIEELLNEGVIADNPVVVDEHLVAEVEYIKDNPDALIDNPDDVPVVKE